MRGLQRFGGGVVLILGLVAATTLAGADSPAAAAVQRCQGQTVYVPVYSYIYYGNKPLKLNLTATLSLRNTDPAHPIRITSVRYVDSQGQTVRKYLEKPLQLGSLSATRFLVPESDVVGGSGASFIVKWRSDKPVTEPVIEAVMIGTASNQGISFISHGRVIQEVTK
jgi:hypothetical protein